MHGKNHLVQNAGMAKHKNFVLRFKLAGSKTQVTFHRSEVQVTVLSVGN